jgi:hypothetical protein
MASRSRKMKSRLRPEWVIPWTAALKGMSVFVVFVFVDFV